MMKPSFRTCANRCVFCFVDQLPRGLRDSLYVKDEDYRLSALFGNFVTLTRISASELRQIVDLQMSPLYVSVHATDSAVRTRMLGNRRAGAIMDQLALLLAGGIEIHVQIVLCPGWNDGDVFAQTLADLSALAPPPHSVGVVPVGLTDHRRSLAPLTPVSREGANDAIRVIDEFHRRCRGLLGRGWVYAADELFLVAGCAIPSRDYYDEFWQEENGIGMARSFMDGADEALRKWRPPAGRVAVATGTLFAPIMEALLAPLPGSDAVEVIRIPSLLLGSKVSVAGLMAGIDLIQSEERFQGFERILIPGSCLRDGRRRLFLDGHSVSDVAAQLGRPVLPVAPTPHALARALGRRGAKERSR